jgi:aconitate hydratase
MVRGTFANKRLKNNMVTPMEGGFTRLSNDSSKGLNPTEPVSIFSASQYYTDNNIPLVIFAGIEYGTGSSRDWAAKGCLLLNVKAVIAESFERIHRSNLVGMGIMPLQLLPEVSLNDLKLLGDESITIQWPHGLDENKLEPKQRLSLIITSLHPSASQSAAPASQTISVILRIDNYRELDYFFAGGVLPYVAQQFIGK